MCLKIRPGSKPKIAESDITVYKLCKISKCIDLNHPFAKSGNKCVAKINNINIYGELLINIEGCFILHNDYKCIGSRREPRKNYNYSRRIDNCVKFVKVNDYDITTTSLVTIFQLFPVEIGKTYESCIVPCYNVILIGLHSFTEFETLEYYSSECVKVECVIPEGSIYYTGEFNNFNSIVSNKLKYVKIL